MKKFVMIIAVLFASSLILVACNNNSSENANDNGNNSEETANSESEVNNEDNSNSENNVSEQDNEQNEEENEEPENNPSNEEQGESALPETIEINEHIQHPEGVTFTLDNINFEEDHISVDFNAQNHTGFRTYLANKGRAQGSDLGGITLEDDTGYVYRYVADNDSDRIKLEDGEQVTGTISFAGKIQDDAKSLTLIFNPEASGEGTLSMPKFSFEDIKIKR